MSTRGLAIGLALFAAAAAPAAAEKPNAAAGVSVDSLVARGDRKLDAGDPAAAESLGRIALEHARLSPGRDSLALADSYELVVRALNGYSRFGDPRARDFADQALGIYERHLGPDDARTIDALVAKGNILMGSGDPSEAVPLFERVYRTRLRQLGPQHGEVGRALEALGSAHLTLGNYSTAESLLTRAVFIQTGAFGPRDASVGNVWHNLGVLYFRMGRYEEAESAAVQAMSIREPLLGPRHPMTLNTVNLLAESAHALGDYPRAIEMFEKLIANLESAASRDTMLYAMALGNLGALREEIGDFDRAKELQLKALAVRERALGPEHPDISMSLTNLANLADDENQYALAESLYRRAASIDEKAYGQDHPYVAEDLDNLATCLDEQGKFAEGDSLHLRVIAIYGKAIGESSSQFANSLEKRGIGLAMQGRFEEARQDQVRVLAIRTRTVGPSHPLTAGSLYRLAQVYWAEGKSDSALAFALRAEDLSREHMRLTARTLPEDQALRYSVNRVDGVDLALVAALKTGKAEDRRLAWNALVRARAGILDEMAERAQGVTSLGDSQTVSLAGSLAAARKQLAHLITSGPDDDSTGTFQKAVAEAERKEQQAEEALAVRSETFRRARESSKIGLEEVGRALPPRFALVAYALYFRPPSGPRVWLPDGWSAAHPGISDGGDVACYAAYVLPASNAEPVLVPLGEASGIDSLVARWQWSIRHPAGSSSGAASVEASYGAVAGALRAAIWDPVAAHLGHAADALVVPDGVLNLVSLAALPAPSGGYLVERGPAIHYLSAERDVAVPASEGARGQGLLAMGAPDFDAAGHAALPPGEFRGGHTACDNFASVRFPGLPATQQEVEDLATRWKEQPGPALTLTGSDATEARFKSEAPGKRVLHLATHGFFLGEKCGEEEEQTRGIGRIAKRPGPRPSSQETERENPLVRAGLALAGANRRQEAKPDEEDGILTAEEISALDLRATQWAVLSACETGVGEVQTGEGVFGLRRAFEIAGARTLIMSLWPVEDRSAREWMERLYEARLSGHESTVDAVRTASAEMLKERRSRGESTHPFYWGAFVAAGDWR